MEYAFKVTLNDQDYYEFNKFVAFKGKQGKKEVNRVRFYLSVLFIAIAVLFWAMSDFSKDGLYDALVYVILLVIVQALLKPMMRLIIKIQIKMLKKGGKMPYSAESVLRFTDEGFSEVSAEHKTEQAYAAVERVSVVEGIAIYVHINKLMGFLLPEKSFENKAHWDSFVAFLQTKIPIVDFYTSKK
jgi:hypothetical protein